jgi:hypothetical protein
MSIPARAKLYLMLRFPRAYDALRTMMPWTRRRRTTLGGKTAAEVFTEAYRSNMWQNPESRSGSGSTYDYTRQLRAELPGLLAALKIRTLLDAPCGDFNWMKHLDLDRYLGADIVPELIAKLQAQYANERRSFLVLNLMTDPLPPADALFCRDCLLHLSFVDIATVLRNFRQSRCKYFIISTYPGVRRNLDIVTGEAWPIDMCLAPFNFPPPIKLLNDTVEGSMPRQMGVWTPNQIA